MRREGTRMRYKGMVRRSNGGSEHGGCGGEREVVTVRNIGE